MKIHATPKLPKALEARIAKLDVARHRLAEQARHTGRWSGSIRRLARGKLAELSVSIEGFEVPEETAVAIVAGESQPLDQEAQQAVACYGRAMDHIAAMADDPDFTWSERVILDLHFETCYFQADRSPGRWRKGPIGITNSNGQIVYSAPEAAEIPGLMKEVVTWLQKGDLDSHPVVRAAMAHLHVVSVHPFRDGNGRISRITQSLVLAREGLLIPEFSSIEEYLGEHTQEYYNALQTAHGTAYDPSLSALPWIEFCVTAHEQMAQRRLNQIEAAANRWERLETLVKERSWPERLVIALEHVLTGDLERARYAAEAAVSVPMANIDFRRLVDAGLLVRSGQGRSTKYEPSASLRQAIGG